MTARRHLALLFALLALPLATAHASAINECIDACFSGANCAMADHNGMTSMDCQSGRDRCVKQCNDNINGRDEPPPVTGAYGALAYSKANGAWGLADASKNKSDAEKSALGYCGKHGSGCDIVESFSNSCAAVASGTGNRLGWAVNKDARQAGLDAIKKCGESGTSGSTVDHSRCFLQLYHCYSE